MIHRVEATLIRRVATLETSLAESDTILVKDGSKKGGDSGVSKSDIERWNKNCQKTSDLEDILKKLTRETEAIPSIQLEIINILKVQATHATKESLEPILA